MNLYQYAESRKKDMDYIVIGVVMKQSFIDIKVYDYKTGAELSNGNMTIKVSFISGRLDNGDTGGKSQVFNTYNIGALYWRFNVATYNADPNAYVCGKLGFIINYNGKRYTTQCSSFLFTYLNADTVFDTHGEDERQYRLAVRF